MVTVTVQSAGATTVSPEGSMHTPSPMTLLANIGSGIWSMGMTRPASGAVRTHSTGSAAAAAGSESAAGSDSAGAAGAGAGLAAAGAAATMPRSSGASILMPTNRVSAKGTATAMSMHSAKMPQ